MTQNQNNLDFLNYNPLVKQWLENKLLSTGCWNNKLTIKSKVNCLLHFVLGGSPVHHEIRGYLNDNDLDEVWQNSIVVYVVPYLLEQGVING